MPIRAIILLLLVGVAVWKSNSTGFVGDILTVVAVVVAFLFLNLVRHWIWPAKDACKPHHYLRIDPAADIQESPMYVPLYDRDVIESFTTEHWPNGLRITRVSGRIEFYRICASAYLVAADQATILDTFMQNGVCNPNVWEEVKHDS